MKKNQEQHSLDQTALQSEVRGEIIRLAQKVLSVEAHAISNINIDENFVKSIECILDCNGKIITLGMGKSGHIARKLAATLASTGTPAFFIHPAEAVHGDLGMITAEDIVIFLSYSGESIEILTLLPHLKRMGVKMISITGNVQSSLAQHSDIHLSANVEREACPLDLAPTASTTAMLALGDALALCVLDRRGFSIEDFARSHPQGSLGKKLLLKIEDIMRQGDAIPAVNSSVNIQTAVLEMSRKSLGMTAVIDDDQKIIGIFTDGDLRRVFEHQISLSETKISTVMNKSPQIISSQMLASEALNWMENKKINALLVADNFGRLQGALNMHDLLQAKII